MAGQDIPSRPGALEAARALLAAGQPLEDAPTGIGFLNKPDQWALLDEALDGVELGAHDLRILDWLGGWDTDTVVTVASLLARARRLDRARVGAAADRLARLADELVWPLPPSDRQLGEWYEGLQAIVAELLFVAGRRDEGEP